MSNKKLQVKYCGIRSYGISVVKELGYRTQDYSIRAGEVKNFPRPPLGIEPNTWPSENKKFATHCGLKPTVAGDFGWVGLDGFPDDGIDGASCACGSLISPTCFSYSLTLLARTPAKAFACCGDMVIATNCSMKGLSSAFLNSPKTILKSHAVTSMFAAFEYIFRKFGDR